MGFVRKNVIRGTFMMNKKKYALNVVIIALLALDLHSKIVLLAG